TDGIRGMANQYPMTAEVAFNLGRAVGYYYQNIKEKTILIGKDTRLSGDMLEEALTAGLCSSGINVIKAGVITTPAVAYLTKYCKANMGVVISASHNPYQDNGIKFFQANGFKLENKQEIEIEDILVREKYKKLHIPGELIGKVVNLKEAKSIYIKYIINSIPKNLKKLNHRIIIDCANGSAGEIIGELFDHLMINHKIINNRPNGFNINQECGSTSLNCLQNKVLEEHADLGFAYDGDADRVLVVDEKGKLVDGDQMMVIYANAFIKEGKLGNNKIVATYMSNLGFDKAISELGGKVIRTDIGDKFVLRKMLEENALLGGEQSGHIIFLKHSPNGDGIVSTFKLLDAIEHTGEKVSIQAARMNKYHQRLLNYRVGINRADFLQNPQFVLIAEEMQKSFTGIGRVMIRPSGTERKIRILLESIDKDIVNEWEQKLNNFFQEINNKLSSR
ncbi:MAG: phosphoglucosamine mutase, partial [Atribacterota bacterium]